LLDQSLYKLFNQVQHFDCIRVSSTAVAPVYGFEEMVGGPPEVPHETDNKNHSYIAGSMLN
jgi:hypothetical protein